MEQIMLSIVVVCLNAGDRLRMTIESIRKQTYGDYEIIVKDGLSEDGCIEGLPEDERMKIYREPDKGIYDAMNQAVEKVNGRYIYFLNCGDVFYDRNVLQKVCGQIKERMDQAETPSGRYIFYGDIYERITKERVSSNPHMDSFGCYRNVPCHQACFYEAELMREKHFDIRYRVRADYEHFLWCFFKGRAETVYMTILIANYEGGGFSETKENQKRSEAEHKEIVGKYIEKKQILKYRLIMFVTMSSLRTWLAHNPVTAHVYNKMKGKIYRH